MPGRDAARVDYELVSDDLTANVRAAEIHGLVPWSDHAPISVERRGRPRDQNAPARRAGASYGGRCLPLVTDEPACLDHHGKLSTKNSQTAYLRRLNQVRSRALLISSSRYTVTIAAFRSVASLSGGP